MTDFLAYWFKARPCVSKILVLALIKSFLSIPSLRGMAPTKMATSMSLKATVGSSVGIVAAVLRWRMLRKKIQMVCGNKCVEGVV